MSKAQTKAPRLYVDHDLAVGIDTPLSSDHAHYLLSVMRKNDGDAVRVFNGRDGEYLGEIKRIGKKDAVLKIAEKIQGQPETIRATHLYFAPIKKDRLGFLIEKATELGVTDFHPVMTDHTENRHFKHDKVIRQIVEAAEQCERLDMPHLHDITELSDLPDDQIYAAIERQDAKIFCPQSNYDDIAILIGPEGGWSEKEIQSLQSRPSIIPVSLGPRILRAETAALFMLSRI
jgi:16S rRNA (uracil1498-N3)-methyltransferase